MEPTPEINAEKALLENVVAGAKIDLDSVPDKTAQVIAETYGFDSVEALKRAIDRLQSKTINIRTQYHTSGTPPRIATGGRNIASINADGNVYEPRAKVFADGGIEHRVAQIAPAGAWRVWAEEETGGEAYVPLAAHKRARSLAIMQDVAARFGHVMVPVNATRYADGGTTIAAPAPQVTPIDYGAMGAEMRAAVAGMRVQMRVGHTDVIGIIADAERATGRKV